MNLWDYPELYSAPKEPESSTLNSIMHVLGYLDYPRNSIATGVRNVMDNDPETGFFGGLYEGWGGPRVSNLSAVSDIREAEDTDDWPEWLARSGAHFASDLLDPLFAVGKVGKAAKSIPYVADKIVKPLSEAYHGGTVGRWIAHGLPEHQIGAIESKGAAESLAGSMTREAEEAYKAYRPFYEKDLAKYGGDELALRNDWEFGKLGNMSPETQQYLSTMSGLSKSAITDEIDLMKNVGFTGNKPGLIKDMFLSNPTTRVMTKKGVEELKEPIKGKGVSSETGTLLDSSRSLRGFVRPDDLEAGNRRLITEIGPDGKERILVSKTDPYYGIEKGKGYDTFRNVTINRGDIKNLAAQEVELTAKELVDSGIKTADTFVKDPGLSMVIDIQQRANKRAVLEYLNTNLAKQTANMSPEAKQAYYEAAKTGQNKFFAEAKDFQDMAAAKKLGLEQVKIPGLEHLVGPKWAVNELNKTGRKLFDPDTPLGMLEELGAKMTTSAIGKLFSEATQWWKNNTLAHPATAMGNIISNIPQMYTGGVNPFLMVPRMYQAASVYLGKGSSVFDGVSNRAIAKSFEDTGLFKSSWGKAEAKNFIDEAMDPTGRVGRFAERQGGITGKVAGAVGKVGDKWGDYNQWMLKTFQGAPESVNRLAVAIDWLKRNKVGNIPTQAEIEAAARHAKNAMVDYSALTPAEKSFSQIIPFYAWQRGILGRTAETLLDEPHKLANYSRMLDYTFDPMDEKDRVIADPWMRESAPTKGMMGATWDDIWSKVGDWSGLREFFPTAFDARPEGPRTAMIGRYIPQGNIEQMYNRPLEFLQSSVNPLLKAPAELMANYSVFKDRPIDPIAQTFPDNLLAPLTGSNLYSQAQTKPFGMDMPAAYEYILGQIPGGRTIGAASELGRGMGLWSDPYKAETSPPEALQGWLSGFKTYPFDRAKAEGRRKREIQIQERDIKSQIKYATSKGDYENVDRLHMALEELGKKKARKLGYSAEE